MRKLDPTFGWQLSGGSRRHRTCLAGDQTLQQPVDQNIWEQQTLCCGMFGQVKARFWFQTRLDNGFVRIARPFVLLKS